jgi:hypothetical protein
MLHLVLKARSLLASEAAAPISSRSSIQCNFMVFSWNGGFEAQFASHLATVRPVALLVNCKKCAYVALTPA